MSGAAARSITKKFVLLFVEADDEGQPPEGWFPTPDMVLKKSPEVLRTAGLSGRKAEYILDLSARFADGRLNAHDMIHDSDEEIIKKLVEVRGIGQWSTDPYPIPAPIFPSVLSFSHTSYHSLDVQQYPDSSAHSSNSLFLTARC